MKLYLLRHAERGHGPEQDILTELGKKQSEEIVPYLTNLKIDQVICAETNRAKRTIEPFILSFNSKVEYTSLVNEQEMGELSGKSGLEYKNALEKSGLTKEDFRPKGGENYRDLMNRVKIFLNRLKKEKYQNILVVTHAGFIRSIINLILNVKKDTLNFDAASLTFIEFNDQFEVLDYKLNQTII